jgi:hypothetical protein
MRALLVGLLTMGCVSGCVGSAGSKGPAEPREPEPHTGSRWAYFCFEESDVNDVNFKANAAGVNGWEMVAAANGNQGAIWCFRQVRPAP